MSFLQHRHRPPRTCNRAKLAMAPLSLLKPLPKYCAQVLADADCGGALSLYRSYNHVGCEQSTFPFLDLGLLQQHASKSCAENYGDLVDSRSTRGRWRGGLMGAGQAEGDETRDSFRGMQRSTGRRDVGRGTSERLVCDLTLLPKE